MKKQHQKNERRRVVTSFSLVGQSDRRQPGALCPSIYLLYTLRLESLYISTI